MSAVGGDAFAYCDKLTTVLIGEGVKTMNQGVFYGSAVKDAYVKALTPPSIASYLFSSNPTIHVYASALDAYLASPWADFGTIVGDLEDVLDGIETIEEELSQGKIVDETPIYNLQGIQVTNLQPGTIYIQNGKKFMK